MKQYCTKGCVTQTDEVVLETPEFITWNCWDEPTHKTTVFVDPCLVEPIKELWSHGVITRGCCCGHGKATRNVLVDPKSISLMIELGHEQFAFQDRSDSFYI